jgi:hypothetical protein
MSATKIDKVVRVGALREMAREGEFTAVLCGKAGRHFPAFGYRLH